MLRPAGPALAQPGGVALPKQIAIGILSGAESSLVALANLTRAVPRVYRRYHSWDLLKAHRIAQRLSDGDAVLDVGCGNGHVLDELGLFRKLHRVGVDIAPRRRPFGVEVMSFDGWSLPFPDRTFDVVMFCYVLHHLSPSHARQLLGEALRVSRRAIILLEDTLPRWGRLYRLRNRAHRLCTELQYGAASAHYRPAGSEAMFLTHEGWRQFLADLSDQPLEIEPLEEISQHAHHTLIAMTRRVTDEPRATPI